MSQWVNMMINSRETVLKTIIERAIKKLVCNSLKICESDYSPSLIEYYPIWTQSKIDKSKTLLRIKIRNSSKDKFSIITNQNIEDAGLLEEDIIEYFEDIKIKKVPIRDLQSKYQEIFM